MRYDLAIIGGGAAALAAAAKANELGIKTVLMSKGLPLGGTCVNVGCVPSKMLLETGFDLWRALHPRFRAVAPAAPPFKFSEAIAEKDELIQVSREAKYKALQAEYKSVELIEERARFEGEGKIRAGSRLLETEYTLIATGSSNRPLEIAGMDALSPGDILDNSAAFQLRECPKSMIILGGGPMGLEIAQMFAHFGSKVTLLAATDRLLPRAEPEISRMIREILEEEGLAVRVGIKATAVRKDGQEIVLSVEDEGRPCEFRAEKLVVAIGLKGNTEDLNLSSVGLAPDERGFIEVDEFMRTRAAKIYAAGDAAGPPWLEPLAAREGALAVENALAGKRLSINYDAVPSAVFTEPQVALVGLSEEEAVKRFGRCDCRTVELKKVSKAAITNQTRGVAKMIIHSDTRVIIGFQAVSPSAAEFVHEAALAIQHGLKVDDLANLVHVFPAYGEVVMITAQAFTRGAS